MEVHAEEVNDCAKLIMHRLIARHIRKHPSALEPVRMLVKSWLREKGAVDFATDWDRILAAGPDDVARRIVARDEHMTWLRISTPMIGIEGFSLKDPDIRRRIWRMAKKMVVRRSENSTYVLDAEGPAETPSGPSVRFP